MSDTEDVIESGASLAGWWIAAAVAVLAVVGAVVLLSGARPSAGQASHDQTQAGVQTDASAPAAKAVATQAAKFAQRAAESHARATETAAQSGAAAAGAAAQTAAAEPPLAPEPR